MFLNREYQDIYNETTDIVATNRKVNLSKNDIINEKFPYKEYSKIQLRLFDSPGKYDPLDNTHGPKYTIGLKRDSQKERNLSVPGVGTYNLTKDEDFKVPSYIISKEQRKNLNMNYSALNYPAPNKYTYDLEGASSKAPKWSFSKSERFGKSSKPKSALLVRSSSVPGPGSYKTQDFIGHDGPIFSFPKEKFNHADALDIAMQKKTMNYPSATTYNSSIRYIPSSPFIKIPKSKRKEIDSDKSSLHFPGPGHYHPNKYNSSVMRHFPVWSIFKSERDESKQGQSKKKEKIITPGPG